MTTTTSFAVRERALLFDPVAAPRPSHHWLKRMVRRIRLHLALAQVHADLVRLPDYVLRDIDIHYALYSATRVIVRRERTRAKVRWPWTS